MLNENAYVSDRASNRYIDHALGADTGADLDFLVVKSGTPGWRDCR